MAELNEDQGYNSEAEEEVDIPQITDENTVEDEAEKSQENTRKPRKQYIPQPQFDRITRSKSKQTQPTRNKTFYVAFAAGSTQSIYNDPETLEQAKARSDWPK